MRISKKDRHRLWVQQKCSELLTAANALCVSLEHENWEEEDWDNAAATVDQVAKLIASTWKRTAHQRRAIQPLVQLADGLDLQKELARAAR